MTYEEQLVEVKNKKRGVIEQRPKCKKKVGKKHWAVRFISQITNEVRMSQWYATKRDAEKAKTAYEKGDFWSKHYKFEVEKV